MTKLKFVSTISKVGDALYIRVPNIHMAAGKKLKGKQLKVILDDEI